MKLDHREFISKHHKGVGDVDSLVRAKRQNSPNRTLILLVLLIYSGMFALLVTMAYYNQITLVAAACGFIFFLLVGIFVYRSYAVNQKQYKELNLLNEVLQGSRGARLITDNADNTVYKNTKFEELCKGIGPPGYGALVKLFENNDEAISHFRVLADQAHRGLTDSLELQSRYEDRERYFLVTAQPVHGWEGYIHWRIDDVTQKHTVEKAIRDEREKLIDFTDNAPVGFFSVDEKGHFVFANATFARWVGEDLQTILHRATLHTYLEDPPKTGKPYDLIDNAGARQVVELQMKGPGGKTFLASINQIVVQESDGQVRTRAVIHDLTAEREMRQALQASEDRFQRFFEEAPLGITFVNKGGIVQDCNATFALMLGMTTEEIEGSLFADLVGEDDREEAWSAIEAIRQGERMEAPLEMTLVGHNDVQVETQMHARRFRESGSIVLHFIDKREQKALEEQFAQGQKMQAIGQLAGGVAHDFNNLLTAIIGFCDLLLQKHKPGDPSFNDIMQIKQNSNRASNLVRQLLAFSRQQTLRPKVQDVTDILTEVSHLLRRLIGADIELELVHGQDLGLVKVDEGQMEQVLINLAVNARDAMAEKGESGGSLTINTKNYSNRKTKELISEEMPKGNWTLIEVQDTGCGIPKDNLARIFEPFFTTKEVGHGTGLGLATVYGIIRQTGGYLDVTSKEGKGTTFMLYLPHASEAEVEAEAEEAVEESVEAQDLTGTERILLVEDEDAVRTFSQRALSNKGYEVLTAEDGESAIALMDKEDNKQIDLLITDVVMPNMDGPTLAQRMRQDAPKLKIIFVSGYTEDRLKDHMGEGIHYLPKPFTLKQLAAKVKEVMAE